MVQAVSPPSKAATLSESPQSVSSFAGEQASSSECEYNLHTVRQHDVVLLLVVISHWVDSDTSILGSVFIEFSSCIYTADSSSQKTDRSELLNRPPTFTDLMNGVATKVVSKWQMIGILLHVSYSELERISKEKDDIFMRLAEVFDLWQKRGSPPYTWTTIIDALRAPLVGEVQLAKEVEEWVTKLKAS